MEGADEEQLYGQIGRLKVELGWLKKSPGYNPCRALGLAGPGLGGTAGPSMRAGGGRPGCEVFNTDQGVQFTSTTFTDVLTKAGVTISMDGRGRALDNIFVERLWRSVKYEDVYLNGYATIAELIVGLTRYFAFYNGERPHQALGNRTPHVVYVTGDGGGASIPDYWKKNEPADPATGQRCSAAIEATATA